MQIITTTILAIAVSFVGTTPFKRATLDIWSPRIISPGAMTVWVAGSTVNNTWDTSDAPAVITNQAGIALNKGDHVGNKGLLKEFGLFSLPDGSIEVTVPDVLAGNDYSVAHMSLSSGVQVWNFTDSVFGDSDNSSPQFTITA
ncbi:hypothetical protein V5O48_008350 [Marasmius crinis-equi]|uniref:Uncharacterized protein n=1 Tax=Marasmius crinis-equi TaxID=585013 RepID=A0ABR3FE52_9AGAR